VQLQSTTGSANGDAAAELPHEQPQRTAPFMSVKQFVKMRRAGDSSPVTGTDLLVRAESGAGGAPSTGGYLNIEVDRLSNAMPHAHFNIHQLTNPQDPNGALPPTASDTFQTNSLTYITRNRHLNAQTFHDLGIRAVRTSSIDALTAPNGRVTAADDCRLIPCACVRLRACVRLHAMFQNLVTKLWSAGVRRPTEIQCLAIPTFFAGTTLYIQAETGTGKTLAYLLPLLTKLQYKVNTRTLRTAALRSILPTLLNVRVRCAVWVSGSRGEPAVPCADHSADA
jgi:hypothetical protein